MSTMSGGPNIITNGLVLHLDAGNIKSFKGEPTTNLVTPFPTSTSTAIGYNFGFEYDATVVSSPSSGIIFSDKTWIKCVKNLGTNGRSGFLGIGGLISGGTYEWSAYIYCDDNRVTSLNMGSDNGGVSYNIRNSSYNASTLGVVQRISSSFVSVSGNQLQGIRGGSTDAVGSTFYITGMQVENKGYATPVVSGSRGTTVATGGGWADRTINAIHGELVNGPTYNAANGGSIVFDGVDDYISTNYSGTTAFTYEVFLKPTNVSKDQMYIGYTPITAHYLRIVNSKAFLSISANGQKTLSHDLTLQNNQIYHIVSIYNGIQMKIYVNNQLTTSSAINESTFTWGIDRIGRWTDGDQRSFVGNIYSVKIYNKELTASEIQQNYNANKSRFGL